ncbi:MAG: helix-turn-helix domain-containing protein [Floccifex sp.]
MNLILIGQFISKKRKEQNLTQEQFAQRIGVSNKTVSKWETGKSMPDYSVVQSLCDELHISVSELLEGKESADIQKEEKMMDLLKRIQDLEKQRENLYGILLIVMGIALLSLSKTFGGSNFKDFLSGFLCGLSLVEMLCGVYVVGKTLRK